MDQTKFLFTSKKCEPKGSEGIKDNGNGVVIVHLREQVKITHNYKKNNRMEIIFLSDGARYIIPSEKELEAIYRIHLGNTNFTHPARKYCDDHLQPC